MARESQRQVLSNKTSVKQTEVQGLVIKRSHNVTVTQTEVQGLLLIQAALQAAIEAAIIVLGTNENNNIKQLQKIAQSLETTTIESQTVVIKDSDGITITQTELQIDIVIQAAINLLAQLLAQVAVV